ncbi:hypothetical protein, partial [Salmonella enterica]|uniref:hypothetical protein n=1 Tax=Salmonella enterica TaxID=28901 RepID=UPI0019D1AD1A
KPLWGVADTTSPEFYVGSWSFLLYFFAGDPTTLGRQLIICAIDAFSRKGDASLRAGAHFL